MKRLRGIICAFVIALSLPSITVSATTLDDVINEQQENEEQQAPEQQAPVQQEPAQNNGSSSSDVGGLYKNGALIDTIQDASTLDGPSEGATKVNQGIKKVATFIIQILSYGVTCLMVVRVVLDLTYITLPFTRSILANGYGGQVMGQQGMGQPGMGGGMGGMGMGGMGMGMGGGYGMRGGMGMGGMGMNRMGMGGMGGMQGGSQPGASPAMGRVQWVSTAALNAVTNETQSGPDGRPQSPLKMYSKDMIPMLTVTPILLVLAISGVLSDLGFMLGELLTRAISGMGNMF